MLIVFGIGETVRLMGSLTYICERCGKRATHNILKRRRRLSIFFIPVLTFGQASFADECTACGRVLDISESDAEAVSAGMKPGPQDAANWSPQDR